MAMDILSKQCIIIGVNTMILCINYILIEMQQLWLAFNSFYDHPRPYIFESSLHIAGFVSIMLCVVLKIIGIKKKRANLVVPSLIAALGIVTFTMYYGLTSISAFNWFDINGAIYISTICGVAAIVLYPLFRVFYNIRNEKQSDVKDINSTNQCKSYVGRI